MDALNDERLVRDQIAGKEVFELPAGQTYIHGYAASGGASVMVNSLASPSVPEKATDPG